MNTEIKTLIELNGIDSSLVQNILLVELTLKNVIPTKEGILYELYKYKDQIGIPFFDIKTFLKECKGLNLNKDLLYHYCHNNDFARFIDHDLIRLREDISSLDLLKHFNYHA